jgi:DinB superfamily
MSPTYSSRSFLEQRIAETESIVGELRRLSDIYTHEMFLVRPYEAGWSAAQVIEHLNSYNRFYLPAIWHALGKTPLPKPREKFQAGWLGAYFANLMMPASKGSVQKKMQSPRDHRPSPALDTARVLDEFFLGEKQLLEQLHASFMTDIGALRIPVSISPLIRLKLGDTFHFLIAHQLRHLEQVKRVFSGIQSTPKIQ